MSEIQPYVCDWRFGIKNNSGGIWTPKTFDSREKAQEYLDSQRKDSGFDLSRHKVIPVNVTVTARADQSPAQSVQEGK